jgi:hypothetical protein
MPMRPLQLAFLLPRPDLTSMLASIVESSGAPFTSTNGFSGNAPGQRAKNAVQRVLNGPFCHSQAPHGSILAQMSPTDGRFTGQSGQATGQAKVAELTQVFHRQRLNVGQRLLAEAVTFLPFELPMGARVSKAAASAILPPPPGMGGQPPAPAPMPVPPPAPMPGAPFAPPPPPVPLGLTPGAPQNVPGNAAIKSVIQTKGPISASGDFANPNAGQDVPTGMKASAYPRLSRLLVLRNRTAFGT